MGLQAPGVFFVFAFAQVVFGDSPHAVRIVEALGWVSVAVAFALYTKRRMGDARLGLLGGMLAIFVHVELEFWHTAQPESFAAVALAWALYLAEPAGPGASAPGASAWGRTCGAAALCTFAALLKPPLGGAIVVLFAVDVARAMAAPKAARARLGLASASAYGAGALAVLLATTAFFAAHGALGNLYEIFKFAPQYTKLDFSRASCRSTSCVRRRIWPSRSSRCSSSRFFPSPHRFGACAAILAI